MNTSLTCLHVPIPRLPLNGRIIKITDGTLLLVASHDMHRFVHDPNSEYRRFVISFSESFIQGLLGFMCLQNFLSTLKNGPRVLNVSSMFLTHMQMDFSLLATYYRLWKNSHDASMLAVMQITILHLLTEFQMEQRKISASSKLTPKKQKVQDIISFIDKNCARNLTLQDVSKVSFFSKYYISRIFKSVTGYSIIEYIMQKRVSQAQKQLIESEKGIMEIALSCGFNNLSNFYHVFRNIAGITPRQYRQLYGPHPTIQIYDRR